jgi:hypothetical protein
MRSSREFRRERDGVTEARRRSANDEAFRRLVDTEPILVDVQTAIDVIPDMRPNLILTSGPPMEWDELVGGQRRAVIGGAIHEGLATDEGDADSKIRAGAIQVSSCDAHSCIGSVAGIYTASMPVFVVRDQQRGGLAFCNFFEGPSKARLNYGAWNTEVHENLIFIREEIAPLVAEAVRLSGGIPLKPIVRRALHMGDELHSRNTAATLLFLRELFESLLDMASQQRSRVSRLLSWMAASDYFFLRLSMASAKVAANAAHGVQESSLVTGMTTGCNGFAIRVSGLGSTWFRGPHPVVEAKLFEPFTSADIEWIGGESQHAEAVGLGGFAQAAAFALQAYQGGTAQAMIDLNLSMYDITVGEHPEFKIPYFGFRGTPTGIDVFRVIETGILPCIDGGLAGRGGGQVGAGTLRAPMACFRAAASAYETRYLNP